MNAVGNMVSNYNVKKPKLLYIDRNGNIYPDCKTYKSPVIAHVYDKNVEERILDYIFGKGKNGLFNMVTVEFSSLCHAKCFYCFQEDGHRGEPYKYYDEIMRLLMSLNIKWLFFSGGEILDQFEAMKFIQEVRRKDRNVWIHLKTNGNAKEDRVDFIAECCNSIMVSFNGFSSTTSEILMDVDVSVTKEFCKYVKNHTNTNLGLKYLSSPVSFIEINPFFEWALKLEAQCIVFQTVYNYSYNEKGICSRGDSTFENLPTEYWSHIFTRTGDKFGKILEKNKNKLNKKKCFLSADKEFLDMLPLDRGMSQFFRTDGVYHIE